jgi:hypothetical protein
MRRVRTALASFGLAAALGIAALQGPGYALASDDEGNGQRVIEEENPDFSDGDIAGIVYHIDGDSQQRIVTILDKDTGLAVKAYVVAPGPLSQIKNSQVCIGRFVTAHGVRVNDKLLDAEGFDVDQTTQCHQPATK